MTQDEHSRLDVRQALQQALGSAYTLGRELGGGGMSRTFLATEHALARQVVVKALAPELLAGISVERFKREVLLAAGLQHPHVVPVLSAGDANGLPWFTMPYVDGDSLRDRLATGPVPIDAAIRILRDVARALEFAHARGIVHRDIKPDNILLAGSSATVTDFGIAKAVERSRTRVPDAPTAGTGTAAPLTGMGMSLGTPAYMAPEQAAGDPALDHRADVYAFGATAYELLTGRPPFAHDTPSRVISAHFSEVPRDVRESRPDVPAALAELVARCLAKDPAARPQEAHALVQALDALGGASSTGPTHVAHAPLRLGRALAVWAAGTAVVVALAWGATLAFDVPDWSVPGAAGVMLLGLVAIVVTWWVQYVSRRAPTLERGHAHPAGTLATMALRAAPHVSWRRTVRGGAIALGGFVALVVGFVVLRAQGIGPMGSLRGAGDFGERETLVVADFRSPAGDSTLGATASEAIRTDLAQSSRLRVLTRGALADLLSLMGRTGQPRVEFDVARQIATREGAKAVLDGAIDKLGPSYVVSARLVAALDGRELATFRETASDDAELVPALGRLSRDIRGKVGESLRDIRASLALERVSTASLPALRKYVDAGDAISALGDRERGRALLKEAVTLDSTFAMAWRRLASTYVGSGRDRQAQLHAITQAYRYRERLTENERLLTEASYFTYGPRPDLDRSIAAYDALIALDSTNSAALNNGATSHARRGDRTRAIALLERATRLERPFGGAFTNLSDLYLMEGNVPAARRTVDRMATVLPRNSSMPYARLTILAASGALDSAERIATEGFRASTSSSERDRLAFYAGQIALLQGRLRDGLGWLTAGHQERVRLSDDPAARLTAGLDSAFVDAFWREDRAAALERVRRTLSRVPLATLPPADRQWTYLSDIAAIARDPAGARAAYAGWVRDSAEAGSNTGIDALLRAGIAMAEDDGLAAVAALRQVQQARALAPQDIQTRLAIAYDAAGVADSAIANFERAAARPLADLEFDANVLPLAYKRLAELYDARGDRKRAEEYYARLVELWRHADPDLQPKVQRARDRLAELRRGRG